MNQTAVEDYTLYIWFLNQINLWITYLFFQKSESSHQWPHFWIIVHNQLMLHGGKLKQETQTDPSIKHFSQKFVVIFAELSAKSEEISADSIYVG